MVQPLERTRRRSNVGATSRIHWVFGLAAAPVWCSRSNVTRRHAFIEIQAARQLLPYCGISNGGAVPADFVPALGQWE
jgi:hypothetical protein